MQRVRVAILLALTLGGLAKGVSAQGVSGLTVGTTTKSDVLDKAGPPLERQALEGDDFWYYVVTDRGGLMDFANILQSYAGGTQVRTHALPQRVLILRFDSQTGFLKSVHQR